MSLTPELVAMVERTEPDPGPEPGTREPTDAEYDTMTAALLTEHAPKDLWIFAYGSLIWNPVFEVAESRSATVDGWHRAFCLWMKRWRGTHDVPCLMMALDRGGSCEGIAYRLPAGDHAQHLRRILVRELDDIPISNQPAWVDVMTPDGMVKALTFVAAADGRSYAGKLPLTEVARVLARAAGDLGSATQYLYRTVLMLEEKGIRDVNLWELQHFVAEEIQGLQRGLPRG